MEGFGLVLRYSDKRSPSTLLMWGPTSPPLKLVFNGEEFHLSRNQNEPRGYWSYHQVALGCPIDTRDHRGI